MIEKGVVPPKHLDIEEQPLLFRWLTNLHLNFPRTRTYSATINPTLVSANSESTQTFTVSGLSTQDIVTLNKPTKTADFSILDAYVSAADTLSITFRNFSGAGIDAGSETYLVKAIRR